MSANFNTFTILIFLVSFFAMEVLYRNFFLVVVVQNCQLHRSNFYLLFMVFLYSLR